GVTPQSISATLVWCAYGSDNSVEEQETQVTISQPANTADYNFAVRPLHVPTQHGVYGWKLKVTLDFTTAGGPEDKITLTTAGETPIVVGDQTAIFGAGWTIDDMPWFYVDERDTADNEDDRLVVTFPGETPLLFNAADLVRNNYNYTGTLPNMAYGSNAFGSDGFRDPLFFGKVEGLGDGKIVFTTGDGTQYHAKRYTYGTNSSAILIDRIEQPGVDFDPNGTPAGRRGVSFIWDTTASDYSHPVLKSLTASDGTKNDFEYNTDGYLSRIKLVDGTKVLRQVNFNVDANRELTSISEVDPSNGTSYLRTRTIQYEHGIIVKDQWLTGGTVLAAETNFQFGNHNGQTADDAYQLSKIIVGQLPLPTGSAPNLEYAIDPAGSILAGQFKVGPLTSFIKQEAGDLKKLSDTGTEVASDGTWIDRYEFDSAGRLEKQKREFKPATSPAVLQSETQWNYDAAGGVKKLRERVSPADSADSFRETTYWHDYETIASYNAPDSQQEADASPKYDPEDYRGNVTYVMDPSGFSEFEYETDDETLFAVGTLLRSVVSAQVDGDRSQPLGGPDNSVRTVYEREKDGRLKSKRVIRNLDDSQPDGAQRLAGLASDPVATAAEKDVVEAWTYYTTGPALGYLMSYTDPAELVTNYTDYQSGKLYKSNINDAATNTVITTTYTSDAAGLSLAQTTTLSSGAEISHAAQSFDLLGHLLKSETSAANNQGNEGPVSRDTYEYNAAGQVLKHVDGNNVITSLTYDAAGRLLTQKAADGASYYSMYLGAPISVEQTTTYAYYADGSTKEVSVTGGPTTKFYADPANFKTWSTVDGVSDGEHTVSSGVITFDTDGVAIEETTADFLGRPTHIVNKLTGEDQSFEYGDPRLDQPTKVTRKTNLGWDTDHWKIEDVATTLAYDASGNVISAIEAGRRQTVSQFDPLGRLISTRLHGGGSQPARGANYSYVTDPSGNVVEATEKGRSAGNLTELKTRFTYDALGRQVQVADPLAGVETGTQAASTSRSYDGALLKVVSTDRTGVSSTQWFNAAGQLVKDQSALGATTTYEYDATGKLIHQSFTPRAGDNLASRQVENKYDQLGRLRVVYEVGGDPGAADAIKHFTATDYFKPNDAGADGWNVVQFPTFDGTDVENNRPADAKARATKTRLDSLGNPIYVQQPDPDYLLSGGVAATQSDNTPTVLRTYSYDPQNLMVTTTSRLSQAPDAASGTAKISMAYDGTRVTRTAANLNGQSLMTLVRMTDRDLSNAVQSSTQVDSGFVIQSRITYDALGGVLSNGSPLGTSTDSNGAFQTSTYVN
ncbi:MAG: hypothetical protein ACTHK7_12750, partial [Aureliella sp.]